MKSVSKEELCGMKKVVLSGLINIENTVSIGDFPIEYSPIDYRFFGIESTVSGVGYNVSKALKTLGTDVEILSLIGNDFFKSVVESELKKENLSTRNILNIISKTPQSTILYDLDGKRKIYLDLKDIQDTEYPAEKAIDAIEKADLVIPCNINFSRPILRKAKQMGKQIATDVHVVNNVKDEYNAEFMKNANILFLSNENIRGNEEKFVYELVKEYDNEIIVVGMGKEGALLYTREVGFVEKFESVQTRPVVSTIGAGDSLFSAFIHYYLKGESPKEAIKNAIVFASYKIGEKGGANGFLSEARLAEVRNSIIGG